MNGEGDKVVDEEKKEMLGEICITFYPDEVPEVAFKANPKEGLSAITPGMMHQARAKMRTSYRAYISELASGDPAAKAADEAHNREVKLAHKKAEAKLAKIKGEQV